MGWNKRRFPEGFRKTPGSLRKTRPRFDIASLAFVPRFVLCFYEGDYSPCLTVRANSSLGMDPGFDERDTMRCRGDERGRKREEWRLAVYSNSDRHVWNDLGPWRDHLTDLFRASRGWSSWTSFLGMGVFVSPLGLGSVPLHRRSSTLD